jgi:hypothetical protein
MKTQHELDLTFKSDTNGRVFNLYCKCRPHKDNLLAEVTSIEEAKAEFKKHVAEAKAEEDAWAEE